MNKYIIIILILLSLGLGYKVINQKLYINALNEHITSLYVGIDSFEQGWTRCIEDMQRFNDQFWAIGVNPSDP